MKKVFALIGAIGAGFVVGINPAQAHHNGVAHTDIAQAEPVLTEAAPLRTELYAQGRARYRETSNMDKYSYIGVAGNLGLSDTDRSVADDGIAAISKISILKNVSARPGVIFGNDAAFMIPVTYDFNLRGNDPLIPNSVTPYLGGGVVIDSGDEGETDFLATGGVDYRFSKNWVGNAGVNVGFAEEDTDIGIQVGVGYVFPHAR